MAPKHWVDNVSAFNASKVMPLHLVSVALRCPNHKIAVWVIAKGSSILWVAKFKGDKDTECELSKWVVAKGQGDKTASF